jgi:hypothetical protein
MKIAPVQGTYFLVTGLWPLLNRRSFERVTGPKSDFWLAQTVGVLVTDIGAVLLIGARRRSIDDDLAILGVGSALALGAIDLIFALRGRISKVYLFDAAIQAALVGGWLRAGAKGAH